MTSERRPARLVSSKDPVNEAVRFIARTDRSSSEVMRHLALRGYPAKAVQDTLRTLSRLGYVNDEAVALRLARQRLHRHPVGRDMLIAELTAKEFPQTAVDHAVQAAYEGTTEHLVAQNLLQTVAPKHKDPQREALRCAMLLRARGFSEDVIQTLLPPSDFPVGHWDS